MLACKCEFLHESARNLLFIVSRCSVYWIKKRLMTDGWVQEGKWRRSRMENHKITRLLICNSRYREITCINIDGKFIFSSFWQTLGDEGAWENLLLEEIVKTRGTKVIKNTCFFHFRLVKKFKCLKTVTNFLRTRFKLKLNFRS